MIQARNGEQKAKSDILLRVKHCRVSFRDSEGIEHAVDLEARTLYEAVGLRSSASDAVSTSDTIRKGCTNLSWSRGNPAPNTG
jgi:hypothetical protein